MWRATQRLGRTLARNTSWKYVGAAALATPVVAILQGSYLLLDYRKNHGDAPRPEVPSLGLVVAQKGRVQARVGSGKEQLQLLTDWTIMNRNRSSQKPLRLLVIGDSLAAGVGTSHSSTPILPESIAQHLSENLNGRAVLWTCVGTPGQTSREICRDIHHLDLPASTVLNQFWEWKDQQTVLAQKRIEVVQEKTREWLETRRVSNKDDEESDIKGTKRVERWWKRTRHQVETDLRGLRRVVQNAAVVKPKPLRRRPTINPSEMEKFDVAIVLTGLNDLKDSYLPFLVPKEEDGTAEAQPGDGLKGELVGILDALKSKMTKIIPALGTNDSARVVDPISSSSPATISRRRTMSLHPESSGPLVVFPALPYKMTVLVSYAPLKWFLGPLLKTVDQNKQRIAELYPDLVLFVEPPDRENLEELGSKQSDATVLLKLNDIAHDVEIRIQQLMKNYNENRWVVDAEEDREDLYELDPFDGVAMVEPSRKRKISVMVSADGIHPSDSGYDMWGKHIAGKIVDAWKQRRNFA